MRRNCAFQCLCMCIMIIFVMNNLFPNARLLPKSIFTLNVYHEPIPKWDFAPKYYYYYEDLTLFPSLSYFQNCSIAPNIAGWTKNSLDHFFYNQLKFDPNANQYRVYDCLKADIFIIPLDLGNGIRGSCNFKKSELASILSLVANEIMNGTKSCWNINPNSQKYHLILSGGHQPRKVLYDSLFIQHGKVIIADNALTPYEWYEHQSFGSKIKNCLMSYGYTSIVSMILLNKNYYKINNILNVTSSSHSQSLSTFEYKNKIKFINRKYTTFFMGQATDLVYYYKIYRYRGVKDAIYQHEHNGYNRNNTDGIWITIPSKRDLEMGKNKTYPYNKCKFIMDLNGINNSVDTNHSYPCWIPKSNEILYTHLLANSKFNLMYSGGDACSSRFYDAISLNVINVVISDNFVRDCIIGNTFNLKGIYQNIPWNKMFLQITYKEYRKHPIQTIQKLINEHDDTYYENMLSLIEKYKKYILWDKPNTETAQYLLHSAYSK